MNRRIYIGGLRYNMTEERLTELFSAHGTVESVQIIGDKFTGKSRGYAFIEMQSGDEAEHAIQALNGTDFDGQKLTVGEAKPRPSS